MKQNQFQQMAVELFNDLQNPVILWQVGALLLSIGLAWWLSRLIQPSLQSRKKHWRIGVGGLSRALFPVLALGFLLLCRYALKDWQHVNLLILATPLLTAMTIVRVSIYLLRNAFHQGSWLDRSEQLVSATIWIGVALYVTGVLPDLINSLDAITVSLGKTKLSVWMMLQGLFTVVVTLVIALWIGRIFESRLMDDDALDFNLRVVLSRFIRAALIVIGVLIALPMVGIDLTVLSVFGGALGVGLGLGLQRLASNYVSGFVVLLDRSVRIGDMIIVEKHAGVVSRITARYTVVRALDGTEAIVPNEILTNTTVFNLSLTDNAVRQAINVTVAYATDVEATLQLMEDIARANSRVLTEPAPQAFLTDFGDNGIALELGFWIADPDQGRQNIRSELNLAMWREFKQRGIEIPFPQRQVHLLNPLPEKP